jgi:hypothetical protein
MGFFLRLIPFVAPWFLSLIPALIGRIMLALGIGVVSYTALNTLANIFIDRVMGSMSEISSTAFALISMSGGTAMISIISSAIITKAGLMAINKFRITPSSGQLF